VVSNGPGRINQAFSVRSSTWPKSQLRADWAYKASGDSFRLVSEQEKAGSVGKLDVERAGAATATARAAIPALEGQQQVALFELAALLGTTPDQVPESARRCTTPPEPKASIPVGDGAALLRRRPDLRQAERQLAADTARIGVATADLYPRISLGGSGNFFRNDQVRGANSFSFSLGPLISWSFPNIAVARTRIRQAQAQAQGEASLAAFDGRLITALKEVEQALTVVTTEQRRPGRRRRMNLPTCAIALALSPISTCWWRKARCSTPAAAMPAPSSGFPRPGSISSRRWAGDGRASKAHRALCKSRPGRGRICRDRAGPLPFRDATKALRH
jgi:hypothetical protein